MSGRFFYVQLKFTPKIRTDSVPRKQHGAVVETLFGAQSRRPRETTTSSESWHWRLSVIWEIILRVSHANPITNVSRTL